MERDTRGLAGAWRDHQRIERREPPPDLAPFVAWTWSVAWDYGEPYEQKVVPLPHVHLTVRDGGTPLVTGAVSRFAHRRLEGRGQVVGAAFCPGVFRAVLGAPVSTITDRSVQASAVPGLAGPDDDPPRTIDVLEAWLRTRLPTAPDPAATQACGLVELVERTPALWRVDALAARAGTGVRTLQRVFAAHVGLGPKRVIRRYRLREVTERLARGEDIGWADLAARLGFTDQAHLVRDVADLFGEPPTRWAARYERIVR